MTPASQIIAVYDFNAHGHHPSYLTVVTRILIDHGYHVWLFTQDPKSIKATVGGPEQLQPIDIFPIKPPSIAEGKVLRNLAMGRSCWRQAADQIADACEKTSKTPDLVLLLSLADFVRGLISRTFVEKSFPYPWGGLMVHVRLPGIIPVGSVLNAVALSLQYHHAKGLHALDIANAVNCRFFLTLQENCIPRLKMIIRKPVYLFPDMTLETSSTHHPLIQRIQKQARGRKIIVLPGNQNERKGSYLLLEIARKCQTEDWFFVFAGDENYPRNERNRRRLRVHFEANRDLDNCYFHLDNIADPTLFNGLFQMSDVIFAVYRDFPFSSNVLTKAALFKKPILTTADHLMGQRVMQYRLGLTCAFNNVEACVDALRRMLSGEPADPGYDGYYSLNSYTYTSDLLRDYVSQAISVAIKDQHS